MQTTRFFHAALRRLAQAAGIVAACLLGSCALAVCATPAGAAVLPRFGQFDEVSTIVAPRLTVKITKTVTFKGDDYRLDSTRIDMIPYSRILAHGTIYSYLPDEQTAMRATPLQKEPSLPDQLLEQKEEAVSHGTKVGTDTVAGFTCDIYSEQMPAGDDSTVRVWVSRSPRFPFIVKTVSINQKQGVEDTEQITDVRLDTPILDTVFMLPKDTKVVDAPQNTNTPDNGNSNGTPAPPAPSSAPTGSSPAAPSGTGQ